MSMILDWVTHLLKEVTISKPTQYTSPADTEEDDEYETTYVTQVILGEPLREHKYILVPELCDFYTDNELNQAYHTADEYRHAIDKYGYIYKSQKFNNADTTEKLFEYAKDWMKNNYHGGISSFSITAFDMRMAGYSGMQKITAGRQVNVVYVDPVLHEETTQKLTVISAEYDLNNPEKNQYKIGIPDVTLNKVYGETVKSGGGGGGGKSSSDTNNETETDLDGLTDLTDENGREYNEDYVATLFREATGMDLTDVVPPQVKDAFSGVYYTLAGDGGVFQTLKSSMANFKSTAIDYLVSKGTSELNNLLANTGTIKEAETTNVTNKNKIETKDLEASNDVKATNNVEASNDVKATNNVEAAETVKGKNGVFTNGITIDGVSVATMEDIPDVPSQKVTITVDGVQYEVYGKRK